MTPLLYVRPNDCTCLPTSYEEEQAAFAKMKAELQEARPSIWRRLINRAAPIRDRLTLLKRSDEKTVQSP